MSFGKKISEKMSLKILPSSKCQFGSFIDIYTKNKLALSNNNLFYIALDFMLGIQVWFTAKSVISLAF